MEAVLSAESLQSQEQYADWNRCESPEIIEGSMSMAPEDSNFLVARIPLGKLGINTGEVIHLGALYTPDGEPIRNEDIRLIESDPRFDRLTMFEITPGEDGQNQWHLCKHGDRTRHTNGRWYNVYDNEAE